MEMSGLRLALVVLALAAAGCGSTIRAASTEVPRAATPVFADAALGVLETQHTRQRIDAVLATPEMQHAIAEFGAGITRGVGEKLSDEAARARINELVDRFSRALVAALEHYVSDLQPLVRTLGAALADSMLQTATTEIPKTIAPAMQRALVDSLGPAIRDATQRDLGPGLAEMMRTPEFRQALGEASRQVGREAVIGSNDALTEIAGQKPKGRSGIMGVVGMLIESRWTVATLAALALVAFPLVWLLRDRAAARRYRAFADRRALELKVLVHALEALGERPITADVVALLKEQLEGAPPPPSSTHHRPASTNGVPYAGR